MAQYSDFFSELDISKLGSDEGIRKETRMRDPCCERLVLWQILAVSRELMAASCEMLRVLPMGTESI